MLMKHLSATGNADDIAKQRVNLLNQILGVIMRSMMAHYERAKITSKGGVPNWDQRPWFRLVLNLIMDLNAPSPLFDPISYGILSVFGTALHIVQPLVIPGFAFAWLELVSHRMFLPNLLSLKGQKGWPIAHQLLIDLFLFLEPHLRKIDLSESMKHLYKGTMRVLLVLLHDYPAFLSAYHLSFCNVIPENCVQFRNLVLSAFPRGLVLPDPFTPNLKIDLLPEISDSPIILSNVVGPISSLRDDLDKYLSTRQPAEFLATLPARLYREGSKDIDSARMNSLVLYLGMQSIVRQQSKNSQFLPQSPEMDVLLKLLDFDDAGRYILLNAIANQLRFPSSHTHFFSCVTLFLFSEAKDEGVREQITRVLLERLIVHRPHPWGLLVTFIELIKNQRYQFWDHSFTRCASEIEKVFESVARSCLTPSSQKVTSIGSTGIA
jgi:CCR4-NOT transcription complex subunit 1